MSPGKLSDDNSHSSFVHSPSYLEVRFESAADPRNLQLSDLLGRHRYMLTEQASNIACAMVEPEEENVESGARPVIAVFPKLHRRHSYRR